MSLVKLAAARGKQRMILFILSVVCPLAINFHIAHDSPVHLDVESDITKLFFSNFPDDASGPNDKSKEKAEQGLIPPFCR